MTTPTFLKTDETAFDDDRALTAEHGRRIVRNALAIYNERAGAVGNAQRLALKNGADASSRVVITANWAYVGPLHYYCPTPCGESNIARPVPTVRLLLTGRATGSATSYVYAVNQSVATPSEEQMNNDVASGPGAAWAEIDTANWSATLEVPVAPGWNTLWIGFKCGLYGEPFDLGVGGPPGENYAWIADYSPSSRTNGAHPSILNVFNIAFDSAPFAALVATTAADFAAGVFSRYTVPTVLPGDPEDYQIPPGIWLLWEPFEDELSRIGTTVSEVPAWAFSLNAYPVIAFGQALDVIDLDSINVDGSQVWQLEDASFGAGLRWWQLPSALQFRQAANMAQKARIAVAPQVAIASPVAGAQEHPLPLTGGKPAVWNNVKTCLLDLDTDPPYAQPESTVFLEACISLVVTCLNQREPTSQTTLQVDLEIVNMATGVVQQSAIGTMPIGIIQPGAGATSGSSILARTIGWSSYYSLPGGLNRYGQEGLTRRNEWRVWQPIRITISEARSVLTATPYFVRATASLPNVSTPSDFILTVSDLAVRIVGS